MKMLESLLPLTEDCRPLDNVNSICVASSRGMQLLVQAVSVVYN
jgi:hypothetical protein